MRVKLVFMTGWMTRTALCIALLMSAAAPVRADEATKDAPPPAAEATYDETQPGADDPRVKEGFEAYKAGDFKKAYDIWLPLANAGNGEAQFRVGRLYRHGQGVPKDTGKAVQYWIMSSGTRHTFGLTNLGYLYDTGDGVPNDEGRAVKLYEQAAQLCNVIAQQNLGFLILRRPKENRDNVEGHKWLEIAAAFGQQRAAEASKKLVGLITAPTEYEAAKKKAQEWLENHPCGKLLD